MDLNDPRKRLSVAKASNPSLRISAAPKPATPSVQIVKPKVQQNLQVTKPQTFGPVKVTGAKPAPAPAPQFKFDFDKGREAAGRSFVEAPGKFLEGVANIDDVAGGAFNEFVAKPIGIITEQQRLRGEISKQGGPSLNKKMLEQLQASEIRDEGRANQKVAKQIKNITAAEKKTGVKQDQDAELIALSDVSGFGGLLKGAAKNLAKKGVELFKGKGKDAASLAVQVAEETDPRIIQQTLKVDAPTAQYLAVEDNPELIKNVVEALKVDEGLSIRPEVAKRLEEEGVRRVKQEDTPYGAAYNNSEISLRDQSFATDDNLYHELGHHIFRTKLTAEEKAMFDGIKGDASKKAAGREGYTAEDFSSEDFSDFMSKALSGRLDEVPESVRGIIQKYARVADEMAPGAAKQATSTSPNEVVQVVNRTTGKKTFYRMPNANRDQILKDIDGTGKSSIAGESLDNEITHITARSPEDMVKRGFEDGGVYGDIQTAKQVDEGMAKSQAGVSDGPAKATAPDAPESGFAPQIDESTSSSENALRTPETASVGIPDLNNLYDRKTTPEEVQKILDAAKGAKAHYDTAVDARKVEHATRISNAYQTFDEAGGGEAGYRAMLKKLGGKYTESDYVPISLDKEIEDQFLNAVKNSNLRDWEKFNTQNALRKIWGAEPQKPAAHDYNYIRRFFNENYGEGVGDELSQALKEHIDQGGSIEDIVSNIAGLPRALMATGDLSGGFRQALPLGTRFPKIWANANVESVKYAFNPKYYESEMKKIADAPDYNVIAEKMGVDLTGVGATQDEAFIGAGLAERIPVAGIGVRAADRAYTGVITRMRYDVASKLVEEAGGPERFLKNMEEIYGDKIVRKGLLSGRTKASDRAMRSLGEVINTFTGRGGMRGGLLDEHMKTASTALFAPRLWAANLQRLNLAWYAKLYRDNPQAAKLALESQGTFLMVAGTVLGLAATAGAEVGTNMGSADFGKIKVGNTRYDILGGQQQNIVQAYRQITGTKTDSTTGEVDILGDSFGAKTRFDLALDMFENKANPLLGFGIKLMNLSAEDTGNPFVKKDQFGEDFNIPQEATKLLYPLGIQGAVETSQDVGDPVKGTLMNSPSFFGVGVQTYGSQKTKDQNKPEADLNTEERVAKLKENKKLRKEDNISTLSESDRSLYELGNADRDSLSANEKSKYDQIKKYVTDRGTSIEIPSSLKNDTAKDFYRKWNSMTDKDQKAWLKQKPDENAKTIATGLNAMRAEGLEEFKPSNALSKAYAEYEKDLTEHPEYSALDKHNKAKAFQAKAYKLNYKEDQRAIYKEGSSSDLRTLIGEGSISREDLEAAIKLDNELYSSGLTGELKFSKKFRSEFGFGTPANRTARGGSGSGGGRGGSGSGGSQRAYLSDLLVSTGGKKGTAPVPTFSAKPRTTKIGFKDVNTPKKSGKKVTINL